MSAMFKSFSYTRCTNQVNDALGNSLDLGSLGVEQKTLASLTSPSEMRVSNFWLLATKVGPPVVGIGGLVAKPEMSLLVGQGAIRRRVRIETNLQDLSNSDLLDETGRLVA